MGEDITIQIEEVGADNELSVLHIQGVIDSNTFRKLNKAMQDLLANKRYKLVVDLEKVTYISSAGWGIFIGEIRAIHSNQGDLKLAALSEEVEEVYQLLEFYNILKSYDTVMEAIHDF